MNLFRGVIIPMRNHQLFLALLDCVVQEVIVFLDTHCQVKFCLCHFNNPNKA